MDEKSLEHLAERDSQARFEDQSGRAGADGSLILADALTYAAGATAFITAGIDVLNSGWTVAAIVLITAGTGLWLCSQSLNNFRRLLPVWVRAILRMRIMPETFEEQTIGARRRRMWTMVIAAFLSAIIAIQFSQETAVMTRSGVPFHIVLWAIVLLDGLVAFQWHRLILRSGCVARPGGWAR